MTHDSRRHCGEIKNNELCETIGRGPKFEFEFTRTRRDSSVCRDRYRNDPRYQACDDGRDASERVAEKYAGYNGRVEGYLRGFSWGLYRDLWFDDGIYRYQGRDWTTSNAGWKAFSGARSFDRRQYERLGSVMIRERNPDYGRRPQADDGLWDGRELGENVGRRAAYYRGRRSAFNDVYIRETESAYRDSFQEAFDPSRG